MFFVPVKTVKLVNLPDLWVVTTDRDFKADALRLRHSGSPIHVLDSFDVPMTCCTRLGKVCIIVYY